MWAKACLILLDCNFRLSRQSESFCQTDAVDAMVIFDTDLTDGSPWSANSLIRLLHPAAVEV